MKIVFMGTPDFAVPSLKSLINEFGVEAVFTQPDRPKGRGKKLGMSPVKEVALENNIPVYQPLRLKNEPETIDEVIVSKIYTSINRGDIFVFSHESSEELLIKRVVGLPGEKVEVKDGLLYVNDVFINEPYVKNNEAMNKTFYVPEGNYLFFGDNRARSEDARRWENPYVPKQNLDGKALFTVYPKDRIGFLK